MFLFEARRKREAVIVQAMIGMYCRAHHNRNGSLCKDCAELAQYAEKRILSCMYGERKPVCKECPVHCYSPKMREQMRTIMRWAGPRMIFKRPVFAITHIFDNFRTSKLKNKLKQK